MAGAAALVVVIVVVVGIVFWPKPTPKPPANQVKLQVIADGVSVGAPNAPATIDIFNEPICPQCGEFIRTYGSEMQTAIDDKKIIVHYHLLNFLDPDSASRDYSTRALAASLCVAAANDPKVYTDYYGALFSSNFQPKEGGTSDPSDTELAQLAESTGASSEVTNCITSGKNNTEAGTKATTAYQTLHRLMPDPATPAVYNGTQKVDTSDSSWLSRLS
jgi:serine/threonine protein kinase, bacterial